MRTRGFIWTIAALLAFSAGSVATTARAQVTAGTDAASGTWGNARELPGLASLNVTELGSRWRTATELPGLARLDRGESGNINSVSCAKGTCAAGGAYQHGGTTDALVVTGRNGRWGRAHSVPGLAQLNTGQDAVIYSLSCAAANHCTAVGIYQVHHDSDTQGFVVSEK